MLFRSSPFLFPSHDKMCNTNYIPIKGSNGDIFIQRYLPLSASETPLNYSEEITIDLWKRLETLGRVQEAKRENSK